MRLLEEMFPICLLMMFISLTNHGFVKGSNFESSVLSEDTLDISLLENQIIFAHALNENSEEGIAEGQFETGSKSPLITAFQEAEIFLNESVITQKKIDSTLWHLADVCVTFETKAVATSLDLIDDKATKETKYLYSNLARVSYDYLIFGMHDATGYGVGWTNDDDRSDVKDVCGSYPAIYSEDMKHVLQDNNVERIRYRMINAYNRGGILKMPWHQLDPLGRGFYASAVNNERIVATLLPGGEYHNFYKEKLYKMAIFFKTLRGQKGESIPVIFRPYHEHTGDWFWWGVGHCSTDEYNEIWQFTVEYLRDSLNVHNLIYSTSPSLRHLNTKNDYFNIYPGDNYVDILGVDKYFGNPVSGADRDLFLQRLQYVVQASDEQEKLVALTEVGQENIPTSNFFTDVLLDPIKKDSLASKVAFAAVWRNSYEQHHFAPYPGHSSVPDFIKFYEDPYTLFQNNLPNMYVPVISDTSAPLIIESPDSNFIAHYTDVEIEVVTNERAFLKFSLNDNFYENMSNEFVDGQGTRYHSTTVSGVQGESGHIYISGEDVFGNIMDFSVEVTFFVDTLQRPIPWTEPQYKTNDWPIANAPFLFLNETGTGTKIRNSRTVYFRHNFFIESADSIHQLVVFLKYDNGSILYLNGQEIRRTSLPEGEVNYDTWASNNPNGFVTYTLGKTDLENLKDGQNSLAVEMHQSEGDSTDLLFDLFLFSPDILINYGAEWDYYSNGQKPPDKTLGVVDIVEEAFLFPTKFKLGQNYPNPFNPKTRIKYTLSKSAHVNLSIFDVLGKLVSTIVDTKQNAGAYIVTISGTELASGIYYYRLKSDSRSIARKMVLLK